ncbi:hypothetical protein ACEQPO_30300 [Bacillus sp. SL00103]
MIKSISLKQPIVPIDEPLFELICQRKEPLQLVFSNPDTVEGTMERLESICKKARQTDGCRSYGDGGCLSPFVGDLHAYEEEIKKETEDV